MSITAERIFNQDDASIEDILDRCFSVISGASLSMRDAKKIFLEHIEAVQEGYSYHISSKMVAISEVVTWEGEEAFDEADGDPSRKGWFFLVDLAPLANWKHPCEYYFIVDENVVFENKDMTAPPRDNFKLESVVLKSA